MLHNLCQDILDKIQQGVYPPFPELVERDGLDEEIQFTKDHPLVDRNASKIVDCALTPETKPQDLKKKMNESGMKLD